MIVRVCSEIMPVAFEAFYRGCKCRVPVKASSEKEGRFDAAFRESVRDRLGALSVFVTGENQGKRFTIAVAARYATVIDGEPRLRFQWNLLSSSAPQGHHEDR